LLTLSNAAWRAVVEWSLKKSGGKASLEDIYGVIAENAQPKTAANPHWRDKVRQVVQKIGANVEEGRVGIKGSVKRNITPFKTPQTIPIPAEQKKFLDSRLQDVIAQSPELFPLHNKLLSIGGECTVLPVVEEDLNRLFARGEIFKGKGSIIKRAKQSHCHMNSALLWDANKRKLAICTGYALSRNGIWVQHSWCVLKKSLKVVETTEKRILYFGYRLEKDESMEFLTENAL